MKRHRGCKGAATIFHYQILRQENRRTTLYSVCNDIELRNGNDKLSNNNLKKCWRSHIITWWKWDGTQLAQLNSYCSNIFRRVKRVKNGYTKPIITVLNLRALNDLFLIKKLIKNEEWKGKSRKLRTIERVIRCFSTQFQILCYNTSMKLKLH